MGSCVASYKLDVSEMKKMPAGGGGASDGPLGMLKRGAKMVAGRPP